MFDWTRSWIRLRRESAAIKSGRLIDLFYDDEVYIFARQLNDEIVIIAINRENKTKHIAVPAVTVGLKDGTTLKSVIGPKSSSRVVNGDVTLSLPPQMAVAFKAL